MRTLVIIPAYNEEDALPDTLAELRSHQPGLDVVVVSDGSVDRTAEVGREAGAAVLELPFNLGIGGALRTGFLYAVRHGYDAAVQFDADGQHDPAHIKTLTDALEGRRRHGDRQPVRRDLGPLRRGRHPPRGACGSSR